MKQARGVVGRENFTQEAVLHAAFELGNTKWKLVYSDGIKLRHVTVDAEDLCQVELAIVGAKKRFGMVEDVRVVSCYEAGRDSFWCLA